jgi:hypothetical protein
MAYRRLVRVLSGLTLLASAGCGSSGPTTPTPPAGPATPTNFRITRQQVFINANQVEMSWSGTSGTYRLTAGSGPGLTDRLTTEVTGTSYTWMAPRDEAVHYVRVAATDGNEVSPFTTEFPVYTIDLRHVIDALFFRSGPMSQTPAAALTNPPAGVWAAGSNIHLLVSNEAGESARAASQSFADLYASLSGGAITATSELTADTFRTTTLGAVPPFTIVTRVLSGFCGINVIACANYGPSPIGLDRSIVTQNGAGGSVASAHELGHAYGMGHVLVSGAVRPELNFMMNPVLLSSVLTEPERNAIAAALQGGIVGGTRRDQALAAGLVLPYPSVNASSGSISTLPRDAPICPLR